MQLSYSTSTTNRISAWPRTCMLSRPWLAVTSWLSVQLSLPTLPDVWTKQPSGKLTPIKPAHSGSSIFGYKYTFQTFPNFNSSIAIGLELASHPILTHSAKEIFRYFYGLEDFSDDEFQIYCCWTYLSSIILPQSAWEAVEDADL
ncbi:hypothetical protein ACFX11_034223 [Malus domestica]